MTNLLKKKRFEISLQKRRNLFVGKKKTNQTDAEAAFNRGVIEQLHNIRIASSNRKIMPPRMSNIRILTETNTVFLLNMFTYLRRKVQEMLDE